MLRRLLLLVSLLIAPVAASAQPLEPLDTLPGEAIALPLEFQPVPQRSEAIAPSDPLMAYVARPWLRRTLKIVIVVGGVLQVVDLSYTEYLIGSGLGQEANPVLRGIAGRPWAMGLAKGGVAFGSAMGFAKGAQTRPKLTLVMASVAAGFTAWVVNRNKQLHDAWKAKGLIR